MFKCMLIVFLMFKCMLIDVFMFKFKSIDVLMFKFKSVVQVMLKAGIKHSNSKFKQSNKNQHRTTKAANFKTIFMIKVQK